MQIWVRPLGWEDPLEKAVATHSSVLAWRIPRTEEPGGLKSMGSQSDTTERLTLSQIRTRLVEKSLQMKWQKSKQKLIGNYFGGNKKEFFKKKILQTLYVLQTIWNDPVFTR